MEDTIMTAIIAGVYSVGAIIVAVGFFIYRSNLKKNAPKPAEPKAVNTGTPLRQSIAFIKVICK